MVDAVTLEAAIRRQRGARVKLGDALLEMDVITQEVLEARAQAPAPPARRARRRHGRGGRSARRALPGLLNYAARRAAGLDSNCASSSSRFLRAGSSVRALMWP